MDKRKLKSGTYTQNPNTKKWEEATPLEYTYKTYFKTISLNFGIWTHRSSGGKLKKWSKRVYISGYIWTPFIIIEWRF